MTRLLSYIFLSVLALLLSVAEPATAQTKKKAVAAKTQTKAKTQAKKQTKAKTQAKKQTKAKPQVKAKASTNTQAKTTAKPTVSSLRNEQQRIKQNIKKQQQALEANKKQVQRKLRDLDRINGDMSRQQRSIDSVNHEIRRINTDINMLNTQLDELTSQLAERKAAYVKSVRYMARQRGIQSQMMFVFSAKNFAEMYRRLRFTREYAAFQRTQGKALQDKQNQVNVKRSQLDQVKGEKSTVLHRGRREQQKLVQQKNEQQKIVSSLQNQQKTIQAVIADQKKKDAALNARIDKLVAEEVERARQRASAEAHKKADQAEAAKKKAAELARRKAEAEAKAKENAERIAAAKAKEEKAKAEARAAAKAAKDKAERERAEQAAREAEAARVAAERKAKADKEKADKAVAEAKKESESAATVSTADRKLSGSFEANKGRLPLPVAGGRIVSHYGQHGVEGLPGVVLDNKGINILGGAGAAARSIFEGEVSAVFNVGGSMGVLVRHGQYISVYCNLKSVSVSRGQKVSARQTLGTVGTDNILQFQLRRERDKLNPEVWLAR
ncbi:MAG: peptidoglycan DD-metalloendopeptidase family protein [Prevotella sp.]|nr:peptidoglycan DD-metalloendopeptidase family protein [Prevotella sp.]